MSGASTTPLRRGFVAVDDDPDRGGLVAALDEQADLPAIQRLRRAAIELLAPQHGRTFLDAGCGTGDMTRQLAAHVAPGGTVVGVDTSATMLAEARRRSTNLRVEFRHGDITRLNLASGRFDGAYSERVFQHLDEPVTALDELVRVTRPGGRVVVVDTDWGMHALHGADPSLTERVVACWVQHAANGWSGRRLPALFSRAGLADPVVIADTITSTVARRPAMEPFATMASVAEQRGALSGTETRAWLAQLAAADAGGTFFWAITLFLVAGTAPSVRGTVPVEHLELDPVWVLEGEDRSVVAVHDRCVRDAEALEVRLPLVELGGSSKSRSGRNARTGRTSPSPASSATPAAPSPSALRSSPSPGSS